MSDEVLYTAEDGVAVITINRPQARNAVNAAVAARVAEALDDLDARKDLSVGIITGAGGTFCAGMDLKAFMRGEVPLVEGRGFGGFAERPPRKPLIAAVEGYALAGGFEAVLACDLVVAAEDARFGIPEVKRGLVAGAGGLLRLQHRIPRNIAMELALTGDFVETPRLAELGLVNRVTASGGALEGARELAARITANGPLAVRVSKEVITSSGDWSTEQMWEKQNELTGPVFVSHDAMEGAAAFAEKRAPVWRGE
ncbi:MULTISPECIES: crotonase/enoyl-CoA hydratase family protein [Nocardiopsis]|uniref:Enoyl-CoA hydratase/isomerase n=1 Tax=Nocardiopsis dassonvillei (strain ATCC 23218 / DSM 43111 / CIP 107115 / JCM 7437 / KCTC 9190 / NBRC 14626 / NCTC 10488 / NRRL B-5397 / IMRU 509) TaxID=446468 RepID=D7B8N6_NOCDD|nr:MULTISPECIES: crotonase/enoyl-CoA hydratase family protein [Nocardiopsis]ADH70544.1 Enoyl-CoA hydratase/isomerase [Nocardiopsis dassonvillei subsp. dassonvillei DSM 43111]NKY82307.1 crotonase/enoyl-CoA hydratase family protein [Nocardiopsis dassonvillei]VEI91453.1 Carnitinyl-CoA dehydratase [Nocardiopsis dassonvillei]